MSKFTWTPVSHSPEKQISVVGGLGPGHSWSGKMATVLENSKNILHWTFLSRIPSPQGELQGPHSSTIKLKIKMTVYNIVSIFYRQEKKEEYFIVHDDGIYGA